MTQNVFRLIATGVLCAGLYSPALAQAVPQELNVPAGNVLFLKAFATGTQNYVCVTTPAGVGWKFIGPQATLFHEFKGAVQQQLTTHFLSADLADTPVARPTWQHSFDSSRVWGRVVASATDPAFVKAGAIPWLLLQAAGTDVGPAGGDVLALTTFIQRINTSGGTAPATGCTQASHVGTLALVPYTTDYYFYRASREQ